jgi:hypothetical protein
MSLACRLIGGLLIVLGLAGTLTLATVMVRDQSYQHAALAYERNRGNVMYEAEFKGAQVRRAFELVGAALSFLLALNGATLVAVGIMARRMPDRQPAPTIEPPLQP